MFTVRPARQEDFDKVYPLLTQIPSPVPLAKGVWQNLFERQWPSQIDPLGYVLLKEDELIGYIGLITVRRNINGHWHEFLDLTSWTVAQPGKGYAMQMLNPFILDQNKTMRCFTPAKSVNAIFRRFGFQELNAYMQIVPFWNMGFGRGGNAILFDVPKNLSILSAQDRQIYEDHRKFSSEHFIITAKDGRYCYVVAKRIRKKKLPFLHVHYISDKQLFADSAGKFAAAVCLHYRVLGLIIFDHCLGNRYIPGAIRREMQAKPLYRSSSLKPEDIDSLYSEFFVLDF